MDFFRLMSFYHTGQGFYVNVFLVLLGVYTSVWAFLLIVVVGAQSFDDNGSPFSVISGASLGDVWLARFCTGSVKGKVFAVGMNT